MSPAQPASPPRAATRVALLPALCIALALGAPGFAQTNTPAIPQLPLRPVIDFLPNTLDWRVADLTFETAARQLDAARAAAGLSLSGGGSYAYNARNVGGTVTDAGNLIVSVNASLTLLPWSPVFDGVRSAARNVQRAALDRADTRNTLALNATTLYYQTRVAVVDLELARANEDLAATQLRNAQVQLQNGQINRDAFAGVQRGVDNARANTLAVQNALQITRIGFFNAINQAPREVGLSDAPMEQALPAGALDVLVQSALSRRSDVLKARSRVDDATDALNNAGRDRWLPVANVNVGVGQFSSSQIQTGPSVNAGVNLQSGSVTSSLSVPLVTPTLPANQPSGTTFTLSAQVTVPVLAPGADARINTARSALETAQAALEATARGADLDVRSRYNDAQTAGARLTVARTALNAARQAFDTAQIRNTNGLNTAVDVETARIAARQAERDLENATVQQLLSVYRLQIALGTFALAPAAAQ